MAVPEANSQHDADRVPLGQLLVDSGLLDAADLERVLEEQRRTGAPLGRMLVDGGYVASSTIAMALADQHRRPLEDGVRLCDGSARRDVQRVRPDGEPFDASQLPPLAEPSAESVSLPPLLLASEPGACPGAARDAPGPPESLRRRRPWWYRSRQAPVPSSRSPSRLAEPSLSPLPLVPVPLRHSSPTSATSWPEARCGRARARRAAQSPRRGSSGAPRRGRSCTSKCGGCSRVCRRRPERRRGRCRGADDRADELAAAQTQLAELEARPVAPVVDEAAQEALAAVRRRPQLRRSRSPSCAPSSRARA